MSAKLSVVIPYYGVEAYLAECLDSVRSQTFEDFDCVLVDDGSLDGTVEVARRYASLDKRIRIFTQENQGLGPARNSGVRQTDGEYLMFLDSDDIISPRCFEQLLTSLEQTGSDFATANVWRWDLNRGVEVSKLHDWAFRKRREGTNIHQHFDLVDDRTAWNKMFRRSWFDRHDWQFPPIKFEDYPVTLPMHLAADAVDVLPDPVYVWRERESGDSISQQSVKISAVRDRVTAALMVCDAVNADGDPEIMRRTWWHLLTVDVLEVLTARRLANREDLAEIDRLAAALCARFDSKIMHDGEEASMMLGVYDAILAGDFEFAMALAARRRGTKLSDATRGLRRPTLTQTLVTGRLAAGKAAKLVKSVALKRFLKTTCVGQEVTESGWNLELSVFLRPELAEKLTYRLRIGNQSWDTEKVVTDSQVRLRATIPVANLEPELVGIVPIMIEASFGPLQWAGAIQPAELPIPSPVALPSGNYVQFCHVRLGHERAHRPAFILRRIPVDRMLTNLVLDESGLSINTDEAAVQLPYPDSEISGTPANGTEYIGSTHWPWSAFTDPVDNPIELTAERPLIRHGKPLYFTGPDLYWTTPNRTFKIQRRRNGGATLTYLDNRTK